jgi:hypothetical protein
MYAGFEILFRDPEKSNAKRRENSERSSKKMGPTNVPEPHSDRMFLGFPDLHPDLLVISTDPDPFLFS